MPGMMQSVMPGMMMSHMSQAAMQPTVPVSLISLFHIITCLYVCCFGLAWVCLCFSSTRYEKGIANCSNREDTAHTEVYWVTKWWC